MDEGENKITTLSDEELDYLLGKTPKIMPDNPNQNGWSPARTRRVLYEGYIILFEWLQRLALETKTKTDILQLDVEDVIRTNGYKVFDLELLCPVVVRDISSEEFLVNTTVTSEEVKVLRDYLAYVGGKSLNLTINKGQATEYAFIHSRVRQIGDDFYDLDGVAIKLGAKLYTLKATIMREDIMWHINGVIHGVADDISLKELEERVARDYVAKKDFEFTEEEIHGAPYDYLTITIDKVDS